MSEANGSENNGQAGGDGAAGGGAGSGAPQDWTAGFDDTTRGYVQNKGWTKPADVLGGYQNLEKLLGADKAGRGVILPKDDATPEEMSAFYNKLGRPENADGYKLPIPEGQSPEFAKTAAGWFHEMGLSAKQAEGLTGKWNEFQAQAAEAAEAQYAQQSTLDEQELRREWGKDFDAHAELARRARREAGLTDEEGRALERALGLKKAANVFAKLGKQYAESPMKGGEGSTGAGKFGNTPADAKARIAALKADTGWTEKYLNGDVTARQEFERLHAIAFSG